MLKKFLIIIFSAFMGIFGSPEILMASDSVALMGLDNTGVVETVIPEVVEALPVEEISDEATEEPEIITEVAVVKPAEPVATAPAAPSAPANNIQIAGKTLEIVDVDSTLVNSGDHVNKYGAKFLYGHNSWAVFRGLYDMDVGDTFRMTYGGATKNYRVSQVVIFEKNSSNGLLQLNGSGNYMGSVSKAKYQGVVHDLSLMTCYGTSYGNGDASHRLVIFADEI